MNLGSADAPGRNKLGWDLLGGSAASEATSVGAL